MKNIICSIKVCPRCGQGYAAPPALSRKDNETLICPDCGTREALDNLGISDEEKEKIISIIHSNTHYID